MITYQDVSASEVQDHSAAARQIAMTIASELVTHIADAHRPPLRKTKRLKFDVTKFSVNWMLVIAEALRLDYCRELAQPYRNDFLRLIEIDSDEVQLTVDDLQLLRALDMKGINRGHSLSWNKVSSDFDVTQGTLKLLRHEELFRSKELFADFMQRLIETLEQGHRDCTRDTDPSELDDQLFDLHNVLNRVWQQHCMEFGRRNIISLSEDAEWAMTLTRANLTSNSTMDQRFGERILYRQHLSDAFEVLSVASSKDSLAYHLEAVMCLLYNLEIENDIDDDLVVQIKRKLDDSLLSLNENLHGDYLPDWNLLSLVQTKAGTPNQPTVESMIAYLTKHSTVSKRMLDAVGEDDIRELYMKTLADSEDAIDADEDEEDEDEEEDDPACISPMPNYLHSVQESQIARMVTPCDLAGNLALKRPTFEFSVAGQVFALNIFQVQAAPVDVYVPSRALIHAVYSNLIALGVFHQDNDKPQWVR